jgi:hypothetical protein
MGSGTQNLRTPPLDHHQEGDGKATVEERKGKKTMAQHLQLILNFFQNF